MRFTQLSRTDPHRGSSRGVVAAALCAALAAGCGTTVPANELSSQGLNQGGLGGSTSSTATSNGTGSLSSTDNGSAGRGAASTGNSPAGTGSSVGSAGDGAPTSTGASAPAAGPVTGRSTAQPPAGPVEIGFLVVKCGNCNLLSNSYGKTAHSEQDVLQALVNDQNAKGGLLGHKIKPVFAVEDTASSDFSTMLQAICATFTQDHHVLAVVGASFGYSDILASCLAKASIPIIDAMRTTGVPDSQDLRSYPGYVVSGEPDLDVYSEVAYTSAVADGWLSPKSKLGVFNYNCPGNVRAYNNTVKPYLAAQHISVAVDYTSDCVSGASDIGKAAQDVQQAVLKMRASGVDTVAITDVPLVVFAEFAESQGYHPKYLATEGGGPSYASLLGSDQAGNIHAPGWEPAFDLNANDQQPLTPLQRACTARLARGGLSGMSSSEYVLYFSLCSGWDLYLASVAKAANVSSGNVLNALNGLGSSFASPLLLEAKTLLGPDKHAAALRYRTELYQTSCSCFRYVGASRPLPTP